MTLQANAETSKVQILESPRLAPGTCVLCGTSRTDDRKYIDIGITIDYIGVIYFCTFCFTEICNRIGCFTIEQSQQLEDELDRARQRILEFEVKDRSFNEIIGTLRESGLFTDSGSSMLTIPDSLVTEQDASAGPKNVVRVESESYESNRDSKQSDLKQRPDDVPSTPVNDDPFNFDL